MDFMEISSFNDLSKYFGIEPKKLGYIIYKLDDEKKYTTFKIPKKNKETREICKPNAVLMSFQKMIKCELDKIYIKPNGVFGFIQGKSIADNAEIHLNKAWILNLDLLNFFSSISAQRVYGLFRAKPFEFNKSVASSISKLVTYKGYLPQGSPVSPIISNMICFRMDRRINNFLYGKNIEYSRYADDITFSSNEFGNLNHLVTIFKTKEIDKIVVSDRLNKIFSKNGFKINSSKTRFSSYSQHQEVTGIKVNKVLNMKNFQKFKIRAMLNAWKKYGENDTSREFLKKNFPSSIKTEISQKTLDEGFRLFKTKLKGLIAYSKVIYGNNHNNFFYKNALKYNILCKKNAFSLVHESNNLINNSVYCLNRYDSSGLIESQSVAFIANELVFTCLHCVATRTEIDSLSLLKSLTPTQKYDIFFSKIFSKIELSSRIFDDNNSKKIAEAQVVYYSIQDDVIVFKIKNVFFPYSFYIGDYNKLDINNEVSILNINEEDYTIDQIKCNLGSEKVKMNTKCFNVTPTLNRFIEKGMSGSPLFYNNRIYGMVVFGKKDESSKNTDNGIIRLDTIMENIVE